MPIAYIGLGSNMGDKVANLERALEEIGRLQGTKVLAVSSFYKTEPVGEIDQDWFVNAVAEVETDLTPKRLLNKLLSIEKDLGRVRGEKWGPRVIDLDILLYDDLVMEEEGLSIPHPYLHRRRFVLVPLAEIAHDVMHPTLKKRMSELLDGAPDKKNIEKIKRCNMMKTTLLLLFLCLSIAVTGCKKKEEGAEYQGMQGAVSAPQDTAQLEVQFKEVIARDPKNYDALVSLGNLFFDTGRTEESIEMYQKALEIEPNDVDVRTDMGTMYRKIGNSDRAIEEFRKSTTIDPKHEMSWYNLGITLYHDKKDLKGAADAWESLLTVNPSYHDAEGLRQIITQARNQQPSEPKSPSSGWVK